MQRYYEMRQRKGDDPAGGPQAGPSSGNYFGPMMVREGDADAFVAGLTYHYPEVHPAGAAGRRHAAGRHQAWPGST